VGRGFTRWGGSSLGEEGVHLVGREFQIPQRGGCFY